MNPFAGTQGHAVGSEKLKKKNWKKSRLKLFVLKVWTNRDFCVLAWFWPMVRRKLDGHGSGQKIGKIKYHNFQNRHFWTLDGIFEINHISLICLGVFRFEIGAKLTELR